MKKIGCLLAVLFCLSACREVTDPAAVFDHALSEAEACEQMRTEMILTDEDGEVLLDQRIESRQSDGQWQSWQSASDGQMTELSSTDLLSCLARFDMMVSRFEVSEMEADTDTIDLSFSIPSSAMTEMTAYFADWFSSPVTHIDGKLIVDKHWEIQRLDLVLTADQLYTLEIIKEGNS